MLTGGASAGLALDGRAAAGAVVRLFCGALGARRGSRKCHVPDSPSRRTNTDARNAKAAKGNGYGLGAVGCTKLLVESGEMLLYAHFGDAEHPRDVVVRKSARD